MLSEEEQAERLQRQLKSRHSGFKGTVIPRHHSFKTIRFGAPAKLTMLLLPFVFAVLVWFSLDAILQLWEEIFRFWINALGLNTQISFMPVSLAGIYDIMIPYPDMSFVLPSVRAVWTNLFAVGALFLVTMLLPAAMIPFIYMLRAALIIQLSASIYFFLRPDTFPYDLPHYIVGELSLGVYLMFIIPFLLGLIYYVFDFAIWRKILVTLMTLAFYAVALPFQYMLHAYIISEWSLMFMPLLYLAFGLLLDIIMFVAFYSVGMSWQGAKKDELGRYA